jgi:hypothetical protein
MTRNERRLLGDQPEVVSVMREVQRQQSGPTGVAALVSRRTGLVVLFIGFGLALLALAPRDGDEGSVLFVVPLLGVVLMVVGALVVVRARQADR